MEAAQKIIPRDVVEEMRQSYLDYAMSVIVSRALPDVRDGLKPVHRRILFAMREGGYTPDKAHRKSALTVGDVLGKYHPHGDAPVYDALVRMAQDFSMRYPLVDGHGNFGSMDGDPPAAMRYTEARLSRIAMELLTDLDRDTVDFQPNFDGHDQEPVVLPSRFPNLLVNGSAGIAVGMATNIPPHNLGEVVEAVLALADNPHLTNQELMRWVKGPDFPTGALILGREGIQAAYERGRGSVTMRGVAQIEPLDGGKQRIAITEIPYQVNKARLVERIAELVREKKVEGVTDLRDESDRSGLRVVVELGRGANPRVVLNQMYKHTPLQSNFGIIMLALVGGSPRILTLREMLVAYLEHQKEVIVRRSRYDLRKAEERSHILEGLRIALTHLDEVIRLIRRSADAEAARRGLEESFGLSEVQAQAILDMRLHRLTALERDKLEAEYQELQRIIEYLRALLASETMVLTVIKRELGDIKSRFQDPRRTRIVQATGELELEDLIAPADAVVTITHNGYVKRLPADTYHSQRRGGRGIIGMNVKAEDYLEHLFVASTHDQLLFFTDRGRAYPLRVHEIPEAGRQAKGTALVNLIRLGEDEKVTTVIPVRDQGEGGYLCMATRRGVIKRLEMADVTSIRISGLIVISLEAEDALIGVERTSGQDQLLLGSRMGKVIRFAESEVRAMGRAARGVSGMRLVRGDQVVALAVGRPGEQVLTVTARGFGKRTPLKEFRRTARGGQGVRAMSATERNGHLVDLKSVREDDAVLLISSEGILIRLRAGDISSQGRAAHGVTLMRLEHGEVVAVAMASREEG
ncbi:MAG: DNA gyrase subunit A [Thermaerobacter sp.]|nr:DNA gyrase subunit A [Thermaerobacter sp.]